MSEDEVNCQGCGKRSATWHLTDFIDGRPVQRHLCEECYREKEGGLGMTSAAAFARLIAAIAPELKEMALQQCPVCGITYLEFRETMRLGCPNDYIAFDKALEQLLQSIHGAGRHCGKVPTEGGREAVIQSRVRSLRRQQKKAIADENYELAADLRDRIRKLQENEPDETGS